VQKIVDQWWIMSNLVRLTSWSSFWTSFYWAIDAVRVAGVRSYPFEKVQILGPLENDYQSPVFPIMVATIFFLVSISTR
jgi:hypothetical protein